MKILFAEDGDLLRKSLTFSITNNGFTVYPGNPAYLTHVTQKIINADNKY